MDREPQQETVSQSETMIYRNHYSYLIQNLVSLVFSLGFILVIVYFSTYDEGFVLGGFSYAIIILAVGLIFIYIRAWLLTTFTFGPTELRVFRNTVFKKETKIQYSKMASVNIRRTVINRIFGSTTLMFNVNSSINSNMAEAMLTLKSDEADKLREIVSSRIFNKEMEVNVDRQLDSMVDINNFDIILHGFFGQPTASSLLGLASLAYSIFAAVTDSNGVLFGLFIFFVSSILPWIRTIFRYYNYRIYRIDETITVESGLISTFRSSFNINKVNCVRIREPLLARLMGKSLLEAEVVGLADGNGMPLLCPLKGKRTVLELAGTLVPEFLFETNDRKQPRQSLVPTVAYKTILAAVFVAITATAFLYWSVRYAADTNNIGALIVYILASLFGIALPVFLIFHGILAQGNREFEMGDETFMFITGAYDRQMDFIRYDKVQICSVSSGPIQRHYRVGTARVSMMSALGARSITSGIFDKEELELIGKEVMSRIRDGRYDYRRYL